jgi:hypothetical protein
MFPTRTAGFAWPPRRFLSLFAVAAMIFGGCASAPPYVYHYIPGRTAVPQNGVAIAPPSAPDSVLMAVAAGNRIAGLPYAYGGGHGGEFADAYDCSGSASYVLHAAGLLSSAMPSDEFRRYGESGPGQWISVYARRGHVFLVVAGLRFDTGWTGSANRGPQWTTKSRPADGCVLRHPPGL